jgi:hypothetical protein
MEIEFIAARNAAKDFILAGYLEVMVRSKDGVCRPTRKKGTRSGQEENVNARDRLEKGLWYGIKLTKGMKK